MEQFDHFNWRNWRAWPLSEFEFRIMPTSADKNTPDERTKALENLIVLFSISGFGSVQIAVVKSG